MMPRFRARAQLGLVELVDSVHILRLSVRERGLGLDERQVVVDSGAVALGGLIELGGGKVQIAVRDLD